MGAPKFEDTALLKDLSIKKTKEGILQLMLMGTPDSQVLAPIDPLSLAEVFDDFDLDYSPTEEEIAHQLKGKENLKKTIAATEINLISPLDPNKKLLVLDLDQTLFDFGRRDKVSTLSETMRPGLVPFLTHAWKHYNIAIWSATAWTWLEIKLIEFGLLPNRNFQFTFVLDKTAMLTVTSNRNGRLVEHSVKPLQVIWSKFPQYSEKNTIHVDDLSRNFFFNPKAGLKIKPFKYSKEAVQTDTELIHLSKYLEQIAASLHDFTLVDHNKWKEYKNPK